MSARDDADAAGALLEDLVADEEVLDLVAEGPHLLHGHVGLGDPALGQVVLEAADAVEVGVEAAAGDRLDLVEHELAVAEGVEADRQAAELDAEVAEEQADVGQAAQLEQDRADVLGPGRGLDVHQLLGGEDERHLVGEAAQPVDAVDQRRDLRVGADLGELLVAAVHVAGDGLARHDLLAVELGHDAQRAVGGRVLRADVEGHALGLEVDVEPVVGGLGRDGRRAGRDRVMAVIRASLLVVVAVAAGHGLDVDDAGPRLHPAGQQREVLAHAGGPRSRRAGTC